MTAFVIHVYSSYKQLKLEIDQRQGRPNPCIFITPNDPSVAQVVRNITGGWSDTSNLTEFWYDVHRMFYWIVEKPFLFNRDTFYPILPSEPWGSVRYKEEVWLFPNETLSFGWGDCEDQAILLCSMILSYEGQNQKFPVECITFIGGGDDLMKGHTAVQISHKGNLTLLDTTIVYFTSDHAGKVTAKSVSIEINNYFRNHVTYLVVFSDSLIKIFASIDEYIQWMESR